MSVDFDLLKNLQGRLLDRGDIGDACAVREAIIALRGPRDPLPEAEPQPNPDGIPAPAEDLGPVLVMGYGVVVHSAPDPAIPGTFMLLVYSAAPDRFTVFRGAREEGGGPPAGGPDAQSQES